MTYVETCKILDSERTNNYDLKSKQMRVTTEVYKPVYKEEKLSIFFLFLATFSVNIP